MYIYYSTTDVLGSGQFGVVFKGEWTMAPRAKEGGRKMDVAVKTLKDRAREEDRVKFLQEAAIIGQFSHPNVIKLHGIVIGEHVRAYYTIFNYTIWLLYSQSQLLIQWAAVFRLQLQDR